MFRNKITPILWKLFRKIAEKEHSQTHSVGPPSSWHQKLDKDVKKVRDNITDGVVQKSHKILEIESNQTSQGSPTTKCNLSKSLNIFSIFKVINGINLINTLKNKNNMII